MDAISIRKTKWHDDEEGVTFLINDRDLIEILREYRVRADILLLRSICYGREDTVFREHSRLADERVIVLACVCGSPYCTSITVRVQRSDMTVVWSDFAPAWLGAASDCHRIGPFTFQREQYENSLQAGRAMCQHFQAAKIIKEVEDQARKR